MREREGGRERGREIDRLGYISMIPSDLSIIYHSIPGVATGSYEKKWGGGTTKATTHILLHFHFFTVLLEPTAITPESSKFKTSLFFFNSSTCIHCNRGLELSGFSQKRGGGSLIFFKSSRTGATRHTLFNHSVLIKVVILHPDLGFPLELQRYTIICE